jgi:hypothetical protein
MTIRQLPGIHTLSVLFVICCCLATACKSPVKPGDASDKGKERKAVVIVDNQAKSRVDIYIDGEVFTSYIYPANLEKPVLFPVRTANNTVITRGYPLEPREGERVDHPHQVGLWFTYGDVNGYDFWGNSYAIPQEEKQKYGWIVHRGVKKAETRDQIGVLELAMDWQVKKENGTAFTILQENTTFKFRGDETTRWIDRITRLTAQEEDVIFKDNKEGLFAIRLDRPFEYPSEEPLEFIDASGKPSVVKVLDNEPAKGEYRNSNGVMGLDVWAKRATWVRLNGTVGEEKITVAIFDHTNNPGAPAYWHARGYGLFSVNNLGQTVFSEGKDSLNYHLKAGESVTFMYRLYITSGYWASDDELSNIYQDFITR